MDAVNDSIIERIQKLKALADGTSNPNEAAVALNKLQRLLSEHNLSIGEVAEIKNTDRGEIIEQVLWQDGDNIIKWKSYVINTIAEINNCDVVYHRENSRLSRKGEYRDRMVFSRKIYLVGKKSGIDNAIYMINNIVSQIERMCDIAASNTRIYGSTKHWKNSWKWGASVIICQYLSDEFKKEVNNNNAMALLVTNRQLELKDYFKQKYPKLKSLGGKIASVDPFVAQEGAKAGKQIKLQKAAAGGAGIGANDLRLE